MNIFLDVLAYIGVAISLIIPLCLFVLLILECIRYLPKAFFSFLIAVFIAFFIFWSFIRVTSASEDIGFGASYYETNRYSFSIGDMHYYHQNTDNWGLIRYGYNNTRFNIGNGVGIFLQSFGGTSVIDTQTVGPQLGVDFASIEIKLDSNSKSFYSYYPGVTLGPEFKLGEVRGLVYGKAGGYIGTLGLNHFLPDCRWLYGAGAHFNLGLVNLNGVVYYFNSMRLIDGDIYYKVSDKFRIGINGRLLNDNDVSFGLLIKSEVF